MSRVIYCNMTGSGGETGHKKNSRFGSHHKSESRIGSAQKGERRRTETFSPIAVSSAADTNDLYCLIIAAGLRGSKQKELPPSPKNIEPTLKPVNHQKL